MDFTFYKEGICTYMKYRNTIWFNNSNFENKPKFQLFLKWLLENNFKQCAIPSFYKREGKCHKDIELIVYIDSNNINISLCFGNVRTSIDKTIEELDNQAQKNYNYKFGFTYCYDEIMHNIFADLMRDCVYYRLL